MNRSLLNTVNKSLDFMKMQVRFKNPDHHWSVIAKKKLSSDKALEHFDDFYRSVYGKHWDGMREALLSENHKYMAVVNNFSDPKRICQTLDNLGALNLRNVYNVNKEFQCEIEQGFQNKDDEETKVDTELRMQKILTDKQLQEVQSIYPEADETVITDLEESRPRPKKQELNPDDEDEIILPDTNPLTPVDLKSIEYKTQYSIQTDRIIDASAGISSSVLFEYVPPTKIKGMEGFIPESEHYGYYKQNLEFSIKVKSENVLNFPKHLELYTFEEENDTRFPNPKKGSTGVSDYYLLDGGSVLPILALDLQPGDDVLDMCAAPGGKSLAIMQSLMPRTLIANDSSNSRVKRLNKVIEEFISDLGEWSERFFVTKQDARFISDKDVFNKILADVPCTTDRHVLHEDENSIFRADRIKERLKLPELQAAILTNALKIVAPGGTVVYSTCSLSPVQNEGVVKMALKTIWEETDSQMLVKDMTEALKPLKCLYKFDTVGCKYGHTVVPTIENNWGPLYFCKIKRVQ